MTTDERIEALTQSVELLSHMHQDNEARHREYFAVIGDALKTLTRVARIHEDRIARLESGARAITDPLSSPQEGRAANQ